MMKMLESSNSTDSIDIYFLLGNQKRENHKKNTAGRCTRPLGYFLKNNNTEDFFPRAGEGPTCSATNWAISSYVFPAAVRASVRVASPMVEKEFITICEQHLILSMHFL